MSIMNNQYHRIKAKTEQEKKVKRLIDHENSLTKFPVRYDGKTVILVRKGEDPDQRRRQFHENRINYLQRVATTAEPYQNK